MVIRPASEWASGEPGLYADVPDTDYFADPSVNNSLLGQPTPAHMRASREQPADTPTFAFGRMAHLSVLQPMEFMRRYDVADPCSAALKSGEPCSASGKSRHAGRWYCGRHTPDTAADPVEPVSPADYAAVTDMANELRNVPAIRRILALPGGFEVSIRWDEDGIMCKARIDFLAPAAGIVLDYKTTRDASPEGFAKSAANFRYNRQQAWYTRGLEALGVPIYKFVFAAQEKVAPYAAAAYTIPAFAVDAGTAEAMSRLVEYVAARESGNWPGYGGENEIELDWPGWADTTYTED